MLFVFVCVWWCPTHIVLCYCFVFLRLLYPVLPVSLDCPFLIAPSVFSNVHFHIITRFILSNEYRTMKKIKMFLRTIFLFDYIYKDKT
jgi:hypothetical protein